MPGLKPRPTRNFATCSNFEAQAGTFSRLLDYRVMRSILAFAVVVLAGVSVSATVFVPTEFREVVAEAGLIVRGRVTDVRSVDVPGRGVDSIATVAVENVIKGNPTQFVAVRVPGGVG